jgi:hypothetical protein
VQGQFAPEAERIVISDSTGLRSAMACSMIVRREASAYKNSRTLPPTCRSGPPVLPSRSTIRELQRVTMPLGSTVRNG